MSASKAFLRASAMLRRAYLKDSLYSANQMQYSHRCTPDRLQLPKLSAALLLSGVE